MHVTGLVLRTSSIQWAISWDCKCRIVHYISWVVSSLNYIVKARPAYREIWIGSLVGQGCSIVWFNQIWMTMRLISPTVLLIGSYSSHIALMARGHHIVRIHICPIEIARLQRLLPFPSILTFVHWVIWSSIISTSLLTVELGLKLCISQRIRNCRLVECSILISIDINILANMFQTKQNIMSRIMMMNTYEWGLRLWPWSYEANLFEESKPFGPP